MKGELRMKANSIAKLCLLVACLLVFTFVESALSQDSSAPILRNFYLNPSIANLSNGSIDITVTAEVLELESEVESVRFNINGVPRSLGGCTATLVTGDSNDGTWSCSIRIHQNNEDQNGYLQVWLDNAAGLTQFYNYASLNSLGFQGTISLVGGDSTGPVLTGLSVPSSTDVSTGTKLIRLMFQVVDARVGVDLVRLIMIDPSQATQVNQCTLQSGSVNNGSWECSFSVSPGQIDKIGTWRIYNVYLKDQIGNATNNFEADLQVAGFANSFQVTVDSTPPVLILPANMTVVADSLNETIVTYTVSASDNTDPSVEVTCDPASGSSFLVGTTTVNCAATDSAGNTIHGSFDITVITPADAVIALLEEVEENIGESSAAATLKQIASLLTDGNTNNDGAVCNKLNAFIGIVQQKRDQGKLTEDEANGLISQAQIIQASLACEAS